MLFAREQRIDNAPVPLPGDPGETYGRGLDLLQRVLALIACLCVAGAILYAANLGRTVTHAARTLHSVRQAAPDRKPSASASSAAPSAASQPRF